ncbi:MAG: tandem-95 repeat protein [Betaproteobacteria bacterium]|nr:tandem-95 repeat protein [Betaproteobacteria bacterium]
MELGSATVNVDGGLAGGNPDVRIAGSGLTTKIFNFGSTLSTFPSYGGTPNATRTDRVISQGWGPLNFQGGTANADNFAVQWTGNIEVRPESGGTTQKVTFYLSSDDGGRLYIDDQLVINDPSPLHGYATRTGDRELTAGTHSIRVEYFGSTGNAGIALEYSTGTDSRRLLSVAQDGGDGREIIGGNTGRTSTTVGGQPGTVVGAQLPVTQTDGPRADNRYVADLASNTALDDTPYIAGMSGGAELFGLLNGVGRARVDFVPTTAGIDALAATQGDAAFAIVRLDVGPTGYADNYATFDTAAGVTRGYDMLLFVNLLDTESLGTPTLGVSLPGTSTFTTGLAIDGLGAFQTLSALGAGKVWATLIPDTTGITVNASAQMGEAAVTLSNAALAKNSVVYGKFVSPAAANASLDGFAALATSPDGAQIYAVDATDDAPVVIDAATLEQRQLLKEGFDGVRGLDGARDVAVSPDGGNVYVASPVDSQIAVFSRSASTGALTFVTTLDATQSGGGVTALTFDPTGQRLYAAGPEGITVFSRGVGVPASAQESEPNQNGAGDSNAANSADFARANDLMGSFVANPGSNVFVANVGGTISTATDRDVYRFEAASGDALTVDLRGAGGGGGSLQDGVLRLFDRNGTLLVLDNDSGPASDASLSYSNFAYSGSYYLVADGIAPSPFFQPTGTYTLRASLVRTDGARSRTAEIETVPAASGDVETLSAVDRALATDWRYSFAPVGAGNTATASATGVVVAATDRDVFMITAAPGDSLTLALSGTGGGGGVLADGYLRLFDDQGTFLAADDDSGPGNDSALVFSGFTRAGAVYIVADGFQANSGTYTLTATHTRAPAELPGLTVPGGASALATSPDGSLLYVATEGTDTLRVVSASSLVTLQTFTGAGVGLDGVSAIATSADDRFVYVTGRAGNSVSVFSRLGSTLTWLQTLVNGEDGVRGTVGASDVMITPDARYVLVTGRESNAIAVFERDASIGLMSFVQVVRNGVGGTAGLVAPTGLATSPTGAKIYTSTLGATGLPGGIASFDDVVLGLPVPEPVINVTTFDGIETLGVQTADGDDTIVLEQAPGAGTMNILTTGGNDLVVVQDLAPVTGVLLGAGTDEAQLRSTRASTQLVVQGEAGSDLIELDRSGAGARIEVFGGADRDTVRVAGAGLPLDATTILHGTDTDPLPYDQLVFDPGSADPAANNFDPLNPSPVAGTIRSGIRSGTTFTPTGGLVQYDTFEGVQIITAPVITITPPAAFAEGGSLRLQASVNPLGTTNSLAEPLSWDVNGDGAFGDAYGTDVTLSWSQLADLGIDDNGVYQIAARATNGDGYSAEAFGSFTMTNTLPVVTVGGASIVPAGTPLSISYSATDPGDDRIQEWRVNWGDGTPVQSYGADVVTAQHVYVTPGTYNIVVGGVDEDTVPNAVNSAPKPVTVTGEPALISTGLPYVIREGETLVLTASAPGAVNAFGWDLNGDGAADLQAGGGSGSATVAVPWSTLSGYNIRDNGVFPVTTLVLYSSGAVVVAPATTLTVLNSAPTATFAAGGPISEGGTASVQFSGAADPSSADVAAGFRYSVDFNNDGDYDDATDVRDQTEASFVIHAALRADNVTYIFRGRIADKDGGATEYLTSFVVNEVGPVLNISGADSVNEGAQYQLDLSASDPGTDTIVRWIVDWTDGVVETFDGPVQSVSHAFADDGLRNILVTAVDEDGEYHGAKSVLVHNVAPQLQAVMQSRVDEGDVARLSGTIADPGRLDSFTLTVDWGEGAPEVIALSAGATVFEVVHRYQDDRPGGTAFDAYPIAISLLDDDGGSAATTAAVVVDNVAPAITGLATSAGSVAEGDSVTISGRIDDPGVLDEHTVQIDWGDGSVVSASVDAVTRTFAAEHRYVDDDPTATPSDLYAITATIADDDLGSGTASTQVTVENRAPGLTGLQVDEIRTALTSSATLSGRLSDVGISDTHVVTVEWGDGTSSQATVDAIARTFTAQHEYRIDVVPGYRILVSATDDDTGGTSSYIDTIGYQANRAPIARDDAASVVRGSFIDIDLLTNDSDPDADPLSTLLTTVSTHGVLRHLGSGVYRYTSASGFTGTDSFTYRVSDGKAGSNVATVTVSVLDTNVAPVAVGDVVTTAEDTPLTFDPRANDTDTDLDPLTIAGMTPASHGIVSLNADGSVTYTPDQDFNGTDSFTYIVSDGRDTSDVATVTVIVTPQPDVPTVPNQQITVPEDHFTRIDLVTGATDPDGDPLTPIIGTPPVNGTLTQNPDGTFTYTPKPNFNGTDTFTFTVTDGTNTSTPATVTILVTPQPDLPTVPNQQITVPEDHFTRIDLVTGATDPDGDPLTRAPDDWHATGQRDADAESGRDVHVHTEAGLQRHRHLHLRGDGRNEHFDAGDGDDPCDAAAGSADRAEPADHGAGRPFHQDRSGDRSDGSGRRSAHAGDRHAAGQRHADAEPGRDVHVHAEAGLQRHRHLHLHGDGWDEHLDARDGDHRRDTPARSPHRHDGNGLVACSGGRGRTGHHAVRHVRS